MKVVDCFKDRPVISFEVFPPRPNASEAALNRFYSSLDVLADLDPAYISVTYGAGGSDNHASTLRLCRYIKEHYGIESVPHLPGLEFTAETLPDYLDALTHAGVENVLALRGDLPATGQPHGPFQHASDLVTAVKAAGDFNIIGACYPDVHPEAPSLAIDVAHLKEKVAAGTSQLITQLFFENDHFYHFLDAVDEAGIAVPVQAGIMPVITAHMVERMATMCGVGLPPKFAKMMRHYADNKVALRDAGVAYAVDQIVDLLSEGVDGIHLYTMDNPIVTKRICSAIKTLI
ncbi:methylenetetrahydrofolate reductase [Secundilactobacillus kimchicus]|uniref:methylenetetrahydrofolate reductase n=1 Tax=Secundilactobacillus kimchicus TaxID=528209 RepID=UPI0024A8E9EF|nr:methylenetetrahydrofolate reductase [Secundilactobacillus kimchicus]